MQVKLAKPIEVDGKLLEAIDMDLDALTGSDIMFCTREAEAAKGEAVQVLGLDHEMNAQVAAKASGLPVATLKKLNARDFVKVLMAVQGFLLGSA